MSGGETARGQQIAADVASLALVVGDIEQWRLPARIWSRISGLLADAEQAIARDDAAALRTALSGLELLSPLRVTRIGAEPKLPPDDEVRERVVRLRNVDTAGQGRDSGRG